MQEYDTDSDVSEDLSNDEDVLTFLRGVTDTHTKFLGTDDERVDFPETSYVY